MKKNRTYYIEGKMALTVGQEIQARSLEDAIEKSMQLSISDFVTVHGDYHNDANFKITGVFEGGGLPEV